MYQPLSHVGRTGTKLLPSYNSLIHNIDMAQQDHLKANEFEIFCVKDSRLYSQIW